ncbi:uncharacterized protein LOC121726149 [Aricia agestis]|uniref:uncharacterized protein LOC121726149 n=1 Tax=Aricia agestis TaxID=91739 RepID=UPI001C205836|nr:uncharacterized protein LOC121726149 [Aricia agestis]
MYRIAVLALVACAAAVEVPGQCPQVKTVENFDYDAFRTGTWYELGRTDHIAEKGGQCSYAEYTPSGDGFYIKSYHVEGGALREIEGYARRAAEPGKMIHSLPYGPNGEITDNILNVLATDNKNFALLYHCNYNAEKNSHRNLVWVFSRKQQLEPAETNAIEAAYEANPFLDKNDLIKVEFAPALCEITAESVEVPGSCPDVKTVKNFDVKKFGNGIWYEVARTPHIAEQNGQCSYAEYLPYDDGFQVKNYHVEDGELKLIEGYAKGSKGGKMIHSLPYGRNGAITHNVLNVLATDNDNYAILYHCNYNPAKKSHRNLLWVFSRSKDLSDEGVKAVEVVYKTNKFLRQEEFVKVDFSEKACQISASSVEVPGFCPDVKVADNFDIKSFGNGVWYELARTPHLAEKDGHCSYTEYTPSTYGFDIKSYHVEKGELKEIEGYATPAGPSKMYHSLPYGRNGEITHNLLNVLATDNKNYAIVYHCNYNPEKKSHRNLVWVFSRLKAPKPQERDVIEAAFNNVFKANSFLRREEMITVDLSDEACRVTAKNVRGQGFCPKVKTIENFDIKSFGNGVWYEVARTKHIAEEDGQCSYAEYTPNGEHFDVKNYHVKDGELKLIEGYARAAAEAGKMIHSLPYGENGEITDNVLNVLATDNKNYAVLYHCNFNAKNYSYRTLLWVFSRSKELTPEANAALEAVYKANSFLEADLIKVDFSKKACQISAASVEVPGFCPFVKTDENFDVKSFGKGQWYEVKRTPHSAEKGGQCSYTKYTPAADGFRVNSYHVNNGELKFIEGYAKAHYEPGKMVHSLPYGANDAITHNVLNVLATDNDNYAILYHCNYNAQKKSHRNLVWVFSRSQELSAEGSAAVEAAFKSNPHLRKEEMIDVEFGDACQITADSVEVPGVCPHHVETVKDFDVSSFGHGVWYELARTPHIAEKDGHCSYAKYTPGANGFHVANYHVENGELKLIEGYAKAAHEPGKMIHSLPYGAHGHITNNVLNVLATNNKNYAVLYHCNYNAQKNSHRNLVWVFSRSKEMSEEVKSAVDSVFDSNKYLRREELIKVDLSEQACRIDASSVMNSGFCPHVKTAENFDIEKFNNGVWYELARTPHIAEKGGQCSYAQYTPSGNGFIVKNYHIEDGELKKIEGFARAASEAGKMIHSLGYGEKGAITDNVLNVLATDNDNYAILYHCNFNAQKKSHRNLVWVFSRSKELSAEGKAALDAVFKANPFLRREEMINVDFSEKACQIKLPGRCVQVKTAENFDFKKFGNGVWYEMMRTPHIAEEGGKCSFTSYAPSGNGFDVRSYHVNAGQLKAIQGHATPAPGQGQMIHSLPYGENGAITDNVLNVLATDNDNYAILYHCNYDKHSGSHRNLFWVFSRKAELSSDTKSAVKKVLKEYPQIANEALISVEFSKEACEYEAASIEIPGSCPEVTTASNFDFKSFGNGVWYEVLKYKNAAEKDGKCGYAKYTPSGEGFIVDNYHTNNGVLKKISGSARPAGPGKMIHSLPYGPNGAITENVLNVLATDNNSYAVLYHCNFNAEKNSHRNFAWVFSRSKDVKPEAKSAILASIKANPFINQDHLTENDFSKEACAAA